MSLGARLKKARENKRLTQMEAAKKVGISNGTLSGYERNYRDPDTNTLKKLAEAYDVSIDWLAGTDVKNAINPIINDQAKHDELVDIISRLPQDKKKIVIDVAKSYLDD